MSRVRREYSHNYFVYAYNVCIIGKRMNVCIIVIKCTGRNVTAADHGAGSGTTQVQVVVFNVLSLTNCDSPIIFSFADDLGNVCIAQNDYSLSLLILLHLHNGTFCRYY